MILELNGTKVTIVDKTLGYQGDNLVDTIQVTVDKDSTWNYKLDMYKGKSKCFDSVLMTREGNICTVQLTNEILSYGGRYIFQLRGYTDTQTYHSDIFESWVNASIEYQDDCKQGDCGCDCKLPTEFYQVEDNVTEINNHPPYPGDNNKWMIWDVNKHQYVESDIDVISGGEEYQTKANLTTSVTAQSTDEQYPSAKAVYDAISNASIVTVEITGAGTDSDPFVSSMTYDEIYSAMKADKTVVGVTHGLGNPTLFIAFESWSSSIVFARLVALGDGSALYERYSVRANGNVDHNVSMLETKGNKVTSLSADSTNVQYPSAKAVYDAIVAAQTEIVTPSAESTDTQAASAKAVWDMLGTGGSGTDISLGVTGASVGDIIKVKAVDSTGKPTAWEAAEMPGMRLIKSITIEEAVAGIASFNTDDDGNAFSLKTITVIIKGKNGVDETKALECRVWVSNTDTASGTTNRVFSSIGNPYIEPKTTVGTDSTIAIVDLRRNAMEIIVMQGNNNTHYRCYPPASLDAYTIKSIALSTNNSINTTYGVGTKIEVWGVDA